MGTQLSPWKGAQQPPPTFRPMSIVAKRSTISAAAELLFIYDCELVKELLALCGRLDFIRIYDERKLVFWSRINSVKTVVMQACML